MKYAVGAIAIAASLTELSCKIELAAEMVRTGVPKAAPQPLSLY